MLSRSCTSRVDALLAHGHLSIGFFDSNASGLRKAVCIARLAVQLRRGGRRQRGLLVQSLQAPPLSVGLSLQSAVSSVLGSLLVLQ